MEKIAFMEELRGFMSEFPQYTIGETIHSILIHLDGRVVESTNEELLTAVEKAREFEKEVA